MQRHKTGTTQTSHDDPGYPACGARKGVAGRAGQGEFTRAKLSPRKRAGQALILVTMVMIPMFGLLGLAVDLGWMEFTKKSAQTAADAAALAALLQFQSTTYSTSFTCGAGGVIC